MEKVLTFQMSFFGSFINVQPNLELTNRIVQSLSSENFIPGTFEINTVDPNTKSIITETRLQMVSSKTTWTIMFLQERIDINYNYHGGKECYTDIQVVLQKAKTLTEKVFSSIASTTGIRLAVNGKFLIEAMTDEEKQEYIRRFIKKPSVYKEQPLIEFSIHYDSPTEITFNGGKQYVNYIIDVFDIIGIDTDKQELSKRLAIGVDINTDPANVQPIYKYNDLLHFAEVACPMIESALTEFEVQK